MALKVFVLFLAH